MSDIYYGDLIAYKPSTTEGAPFDICYIPEIDYLLVAYLGKLFFDRKTFKKYGLNKLRNMDLYIIGAW